MGKTAKKVSNLVTDERFEGKYVAIDCSQGNKVVAFGANVARVIKSARGKGFNVPSIIFVPKKNANYIY